MASTNGQQRSFIELYNKFQQVYDRLTNGRRDMKAFHDLLVASQSIEERYSKDYDNSIKKQPPVLLNTTVSHMHSAAKDSLLATSKVHQTASHTYADLVKELNAEIKHVKTKKTLYLAQYEKIVKEVASKRSAHQKARQAYEQSVDKAETAVANFRSGRSQVGNDKAVKKLEDLMHSAVRDLEKCHAAYLSAVQQCQSIEEKYEAEVELGLQNFESLESHRLATYQAVLKTFVDTHQQLQANLITQQGILDQQLQNINTQKDILDFIIDTYDGMPLELHTYYHPKNSEVIPHYGDNTAINDSQRHLQQSQANHHRLMQHSSQQVATVNVPPYNQPMGSSPMQQSQSNIGQSMNGGGPLGLGGGSALSPSSIGGAPGGMMDNNGPRATGIDDIQQRTLPNGLYPGEPAPTLCAIAQFDFVGQEPGDLAFSTNATIQLLQCDPNEDWWTGLCDGTRGTFPKSYVSAPMPINATAIAPASQNASPYDSQPAGYNATPEQTTVQPPALPVAVVPGAPAVLFQVRALFDFEASEQDELSLKCGEILSVYDQLEDWFDGANSKGQRGIFPENHVQRI